MASDTDQDDARRLRGRLASPVTVWTAGRGHGRAGLAISSMVVAEGEPAHVLGMVGDLAELLDAIRSSERFVVHVLAADQRDLADRFAGRVPVPGGPFHGLDTVDSAHGPVVRQVDTRAACRLDDVSQRGYGLLVDGVIEDTTIGDLEAPLIHFRGEYRRLHDPEAVWNPPAPDTALHRRPGPG